MLGMSPIAATPIAVLPTTATQSPSSGSTVSVILSFSSESNFSSHLTLFKNISTYLDNNSSIYTLPNQIKNQFQRLNFGGEGGISAGGGKLITAIPSFSQVLDGQEVSALIKSISQSIASNSDRQIQLASLIKSINSQLSSSNENYISITNLFKNTNANFGGIGETSAGGGKQLAVLISLTNIGEVYQQLSFLNKSTQYTTDSSQNLQSTTILIKSINSVLSSEENINILTNKINKSPSLLLNGIGEITLNSTRINSPNIFLTNEGEIYTISNRTGLISLNSTLGGESQIQTVVNRINNSSANIEQCGNYNITITKLVSLPTISISSLSNFSLSPSKIISITYQIGNEEEMLAIGTRIGTLSLTASIAGAGEIQSLPNLIKTLTQTLSIGGIAEINAAGGKLINSNINIISSSDFSLIPNRQTSPYAQLAGGGSLYITPQKTIYTYGQLGGSSEFQQFGSKLIPVKIDFGSVGEFSQSGGKLISPFISANLTSDLQIGSINKFLSAYAAIDQSGEITILLLPPLPAFVNIVNLNVYIKTVFPSVLTVNRSLSKSALIQKILDIDPIFISKESQQSLNIIYRKLFDSDI